MVHWHRWGAIPNLERFLFKNRFVQGFQKSSALGALAAQKMQSRLQQEKEENLEGQVDLLGKYLAASRREPELIKPLDVVGFLVSTMHAGSDATGQGVAGILTVLLQHPEKMAKLEKEILSANLADLPQFAEANQLPYLDSVIREFSRYSRGGSAWIERTVPGDGTMIDGVWVPGGTDVSVSTAVVNMDAEIFGPDTERFVPERWMDISEEKFKMMDHAELGFSTGRRMCIGRNLAMIETKKVLTRLIKTFEVRLILGFSSSTMTALLTAVQIAATDLDGLVPIFRGTRPYYNAKLDFKKRKSIGEKVEA